jgi:hypothetical protein
MKSTGVIFDVYDDRGAALYPVFPHGLPEQVKCAHALSPDEHARLPNDVFALVLHNNGEVLRKYACVDEGNTLLSVIYFMEQGHQLPEVAQKTAAANLIEACGWYDISVPEALTKIASGTSYLRKEAGLGDVAAGGAKGFWNGKGVYGRIGSGLHGAVRGGLKDPLGTGMGALQVSGMAKNRLQNVGAAERVGGVQAGLLAAAGHKFAEVTGTDDMPLSAPTSKRPLVEQPAKKLASTASGNVLATNNNSKYSPTPVKSPQMGVVVDVTKETTTKELHEKKAAYYALPSLQRYPLDNVGHVKKAQAYFDTYQNQFTPDEKREYALNVVDRASSFGIPCDELLLKYASTEYGTYDELRYGIEARLERVTDANQRMELLKLAASQDTLTPEVYCGALALLDKRAGIVYDRHTPDPYLSTYGVKVAKEAEFSETIESMLVTESALKQLALTNRKGIAERFGDDVATEFQADPVSIYKSMPLPEKRIIAKLTMKQVT